MVHDEEIGVMPPDNQPVDVLYSGIFFNLVGSVKTVEGARVGGIKKHRL